MKERFAEIPTADGRMETFITHPEENGPFPAVIVCMDVFGVREELYDVARRIGTMGYYVAVPDFFYRNGRLRIEIPDHLKLWATTDIDPEMEKTLRAAGKALSNTQVNADAGAILKFMESEPVRPGAKAALGYCMGGRHAFSIGGAYPDQFHVIAGFHPSSLVSDDSTSPHLLADKFRGEVYCGFPEDDPLAPTSTIEKLAELFSRNGAVKYRYLRHKGAVHGYGLPTRAMHDKQAANRDWERIFGMMHRQMPAYQGY